MENLFQDLRYSARMLRKNPAFSFIAVLTLALGIGANTAIFSIVDVLLFRPLPVSKPNELVRVFWGDTRGAANGHFISLPSYEQYRDNSGDAFSGLAAYVDRFPANVSAGKFGTERVDAGMVTGNYFQVIGATAGLGRTLVANDDRPGAPPVAMLGHNFWRRHYPNDSSALGSQVLVDGQWFTVVGVTPAGFGGVSFENFPEIWVPLSHAVQIDPLLKSQVPLHHDSFPPFAAVGRLKPGVTLAQAQAQFDTLGARLGAGKTVPGEGDWRRQWPVLVPVTQAARQGSFQVSLLLLGIVALVLLIACADVAGLMLARSETRQREIAVRLALGGPRRRIMMLHLAEALLISGLGALAGCLLAAVGARLIVATAPTAIDLPLERATSILDLRVLVFIGILALLSALVSALVPAIKYSRADLALGLQSASARLHAVGNKFSVQTGLVVMQVAASVLLLVGAGLLTRTLWQASRIHLGFDPEHTVAASTDLIRQGYDKNAAALLLDPLLDSLRAQPGVESAALGSAPLRGDMGTMVDLEGNSKKQSITGFRVTPGYFSTVGIPLLSGRDFKLSDSATAPGVAIVSEAFARKHWPNQNALGKHIEHVGIHDQSFEIVGIAGNTASTDVRHEPAGAVYFPLDQGYLMFPWQPDITLLARGRGGPEQLTGAIRKAVAGVDSALPVFRVRTLQAQAESIMAEERFMARLLLVFAAIAVLLAATGVFGLISYNTERATHDFGIRMALGAQQHHVLWMVLRKGLALAVTGAIIGLGAAIWLTRLLASLLFGVSPTDPLTFVAVGGMAVCIALLACYLPARRAAKTDPLIALRAE